jgi:hypothetical protein
VNLQLPPARRLPNADRMVDEIIRADRDQQPTPVRRRPWLAVAAAAVVAGVAVGVLTTVRGPLFQGPVGVPTSQPATPQTTPMPTPTPTPFPTPTPTPTPMPTAPPTSPPVSSTEQPGGPLALGETAAFENFEVTVTRVGSYVDRSTAWARVCVRKLPPDPTGQTTRVSIDPWAIVVGERSLAARKPGEPSPSDYPLETFLRVGECVQGWIEFPAVPEGSRLRSVRYENSLGDRAEWDAVP